MYRQGDLLIVPEGHLPAVVERQPACILAFGEATGHKHEIETGAIMWVDTDGTKYVEVTGDQATVIHPEHGPLSLPGPASYRIIQQREYTPDEIRHVSD